MRTLDQVGAVSSDIISAFVDVYFAELAREAFWAVAFEIALGTDAIGTMFAFLEEHGMG